MNQSSLSDMIKDEQPRYEAENLDLPESDEGIDLETIEEEPTREAIPISPLNIWFDANSGVFENISQVKVAIRGVDPTKTLIIAITDGEGEVDGHPSRDLQVFKNADTQPVLNMPASEMLIYSNGFRLVYPYEEDMCIKCYGVRTGLVCVFCNIISSQLVPYAVTKVKKKDTEIEVIRNDATEVIHKLAQDADLEALQLLYKQSSKYISEMTTNSSVVSWLLTRQAEIKDINHHLQIDNVIINMLS